MWYKIKNICLEKDIDTIFLLMTKLEDIYYNTIAFFQNLKLYFPILIKDRWYDYEFFEELIIHKLKDLEKHWGKDTHYVGDCFTKKRIQVLLRKWEKIKKLENNIDTFKEAEKLKVQWFKEFGRTLPRLWD